MPPCSSRVRAVFAAPLRLFRFVLVTALMALARAFGGRPPDLKPEPRNRAAEVVRRR